MVKVRLATPMLQENDEVARENRNLFRERGIFVLNLMSSPGSGKTSTLERTIEHLPEGLRLAVIEGDIYTTRDAERIEARGEPALDDFDLGAVDLLIVENVGNLVCPAEFDLGEDARAVVLSVTEGNDKPMKYPLIFRLASAALINKIDLLPYTDCDMAELERDMAMINPELKTFQVSARTGQGFDRWMEWLAEQTKNKKLRAS